MIKSVLTGFLVVILILVSCDKKSEDPPGSFTHNGKDYSLDKGFIENYGGDASVYNFDITLISSGLTIVEEDGEVADLTGKGNGFYLEIFTSTPNDLKTGIYNFAALTAAGTFDDGFIAMGVESTNDEAGLELDIIQGTLAIEKSGTDYDLAFSGTTEDNKTISMQYLGPLTMYDYSSDTLKSGIIKRIKR
jgi:hypothetical protein